MSLPATGFRVQIWCPDCTGEDPQGCGDGVPWFILEERSSDPKTFASFAEADAAGETYTSDSNWRHEVQTAAGEPAVAAQDPAGAIAPETP